MEKNYKSLTPFISKQMRDSGYLEDNKLTTLSTKHLKTDKCLEFNYYPNNKWCKKNERVIIGDNHPCCKYKYIPKYENIIDWGGRESINFSFLYQFCKNIDSNSESIHDNYLIYASRSRNINISNYFNRFYQKEKKPITVDGIIFHLLDSYLLNPIDINFSVKDFCRENSNYVIWMNLISVIFDILPPKHKQMFIKSNTYWNRDMWCLYLTFILHSSGSKLKERYKPLVDYDYSNFDNLYQYLYDNITDLKKLVGRDKIIPPWSDFILENIPEEDLVHQDDIEWGSSFEEPEEGVEELTKEEKKKKRKKERRRLEKERRELEKEEEEQERIWTEYRD